MFSIYNNSLLLYSDGSVSGSEDISHLKGIDNPERLFPKQGDSIYSNRRIYKQLTADDLFQSAELPSRPEVSFLLETAETGAKFALCSGCKNGKYFSSSSIETVEVSELEFNESLVKNKLELDDEIQDAIVKLLLKNSQHDYLLRDLIQIPNCTEYSNGAVVAIFSDKLLLYDLETSLTKEIPLVSGESFQGMSFYSDFLYVFSERSLYLLNSGKLVESYSPGGDISILGLKQEYSTITVLLSCGLVTTIPGLCFETESSGDEFQLKVKYYQRFYEWNPKLDITLNGKTPQTVVLKNRKGVYGATSVHKRSPSFGDFSPVEMFGVTASEVELSFVRYFPINKDALSLEKQLHNAMKSYSNLPLPKNCPRLNLADAFTDFASTGGNFMLSSSLTEKLAFRDASLKLLPFHQASTETFIGVRISEPVNPFANGWLAVSEPYLVTVIADGVRVMELSINAPEALDLVAPTRHREEFSICYISKDNRIIPLPSMYNSEENQYTCTIPPSIWADAESHTFVVAVDVNCEGGGFEVIDAKTAFLVGYDSVGELSLPVRGDVRFSMYNENSFMFGAASGSLSKGISWKKKGYDAQELFGHPVFGKIKHPVRIVGVVDSKGSYRKFVCDLNVPSDKLVNRRVFPNVSNLFTGDSTSFFSIGRYQEREYFVTSDFDFSFGSANDNEVFSNTFVIPGGIDLITVSGKKSDSEKVDAVSREYKVLPQRNQMFICKSSFNSEALFFVDENLYARPHKGNAVGKVFSISRLFSMLSKKTGKDYHPYFFGSYRN